MTNQSSDAPDRRQQILEAALHVFSTKGFNNATNKDIAEAAGGISPGLIYWYFKDKRDLFVSLLRERAPIFDVLDHPERLHDLPPHEALTMFGRSFLQIFESPANVALFRIVLSEAVRFPQIAEVLYAAAPAKAFQLLSSYLHHQIVRGAMRPHDPMTGARSFIGMLLAHVLSREVLRQPEAQTVPTDQVLETAVAIFLGGVLLTNDA